MNCFKICRERRGLTQKEVAFELKISVQAVSYWETGERMPSYEKLFQLADLYETSIDQLLGRASFLINEKNAPVPTGAEKELLSLYRSLNAQTKDMLLEIARKFADSPTTKEGTTGK